MDVELSLEFDGEDEFEVKGVYVPEPDFAGFPWPRFRGEKEDEGLTKMVQGQRASNIEERFYRAAVEEEEIEQVKFQPTFGAGRNLPGEIRPDFLLWAGGIMYPVWVDGSYWHRTPEQKERDVRQVQELDMILQGSGAYPGQRVPDTDLEDMESAGRAVEKVLRGEYVQ